MIAAICALGLLLTLVIGLSEPRWERVCQPTRYPGIVACFWQQERARP